MPKGKEGISAHGLSPLGISCSDPLSITGGSWAQRQFLQNSNGPHQLNKSNCREHSHFTRPKEKEGSATLSPSPLGISCSDPLWITGGPWAATAVPSKHQYPHQLHKSDQREHPGKFSCNWSYLASNYGALVNAHPGGSVDQFSGQLVKPGLKPVVHSREKQADIFFPICSSWCQDLGLANGIGSSWYFTSAFASPQWNKSGHWAPSKSTKYWPPDAGIVKGRWFPHLQRLGCIFVTVSELGSAKEKKKKKLGRNLDIIYSMTLLRRHYRSSQ